MNTRTRLISGIAAMLLASCAVINENANRSLPTLARFLKAAGITTSRAAMSGHPIDFSAFSSFTSNTASVVIHVSESTSVNWDTLITDPDLFFKHGHSAWKFWHIHGFLMEQLRSDGTPFRVVSDADIASGALRDATNGKPRYAILFSMNNTCVTDEVAAEIDGFVLAGGHAVVGGASWRRNADCNPRPTAPYEAGVSVHATAQNQFSSQYAPGNTIDDNQNNMWINAIDDTLSTWIQYKFDNGVWMSAIAIQHSIYQEQGNGYEYLVRDYEVQIASDIPCANFTTVATVRGNDINREFQKTSFPWQPVHCVRINILSSYEDKPYPGHDVTQWVGISGFQAFDGAGNALILNSDVAADPWRPMGIAANAMEGCFDRARLTPDGLNSNLLFHFTRDDRVRGFKLGKDQYKSGPFHFLYHWGFGATLLPTSKVDNSKTARELLRDVAVVPGTACDHAPIPEKPIFVHKLRGKGEYLYSAPVNSLAGWSMHSVAHYVYGVYRKAIDAAHLANAAEIPNLANVRVGAWPWPYVAGFITRHDHYPHFGFDTRVSSDPMHMDNKDNTLVGEIEKYSNALVPNPPTDDLRDFPVKGGYFILNDGLQALPELAEHPDNACTSGTATCDQNVKTALVGLVGLNAEIGTHTSGTDVFPNQSPLNFFPNRFSSEINLLEKYIGSAAASPRIYVSHGAAAHFDTDMPYVGVQTMDNYGIIAKGEDSFGGHPHFALRISSGTVTQYNDSARWSNIIDIPATGFAIQPNLACEIFDLGVISHEITANPSYCANDYAGGPQNCMEKAANLMYGLGGIINLYDHIGDATFASNGTCQSNPDKYEFNDYINHAQQLKFVQTTSTREISAWLKARDDTRVERVAHPALPAGMQGFQVNVSGTTNQAVSIEIDLPPSAGTPGGLPVVELLGSPNVGVPLCPPNNDLKTWLTNPAVISGCFTMVDICAGHLSNSSCDGAILGKRVRIRTDPSALPSYTIHWDPTP